MTKSILLIAFEAGRWGPARLPENLSDNGLVVDVLCLADNAIAHSSFARHRSYFKNTNTLKHIRQRLCAALDLAQPHIVMPADDQVVAALHAILRQHLSGRYRLPQRAFEVLRRSLGDPEKLDALLIKDKTLDLAQTLGVTVPNRRIVDSESEAEAACRELDFPLFVKYSFSWAGRGTVLCNSKVEAIRAFKTMSKERGNGGLKRIAKQLLGRDWYPDNQAIEFQNAAKGQSAMFCVAALEGRYLGGFAGMRSATVAANGPSTSVWLGDIPELTEPISRIIAATHASGFLAFDFMWDESNREYVLLECNPRPNQVFHLGEKVGANLGAALVAALEGRPGRIATPSGEANLHLFPQYWFSNPEGALADVSKLDVPRRDKSLFEFMLNKCKSKENNFESLVAVLQQP
jgi:biotin carboxylase